MAGELCSRACGFCGRCDADDDRGPWTPVVCTDCGETFDLDVDQQGRACDTCLEKRRHARNELVYLAAIRRWFRRTDPAA